MQKHIGVKLINAVPMTRKDYNAFRGWPLPLDENGADGGYLVEYLDGGPANTLDYAGYVSWSPREVFDKAYRPVTGMNFGLAIEALKLGKAVSRSGWNGKGMLLWLKKGSFDGETLGFPPGAQPIAGHPSTIGGVSLGLFECSGQGTVTRMPCICMRAAGGETVEGWLASQTDMLADDWQIVD